MVWLALSLLFVLFFHAELLTAIAKLFDHKKISPDGLDLRIEAQNLKPIRLYAWTADCPLEAITYRSLRWHYVFVRESFWNTLHHDQKEALLLWASAANLKSSWLRRVVGLQPTRLVDRDALFLGASLRGLISLIESAVHERLQRPASALGTSILGLGLLERSPEKRIQNLMLELTKWGSADRLDEQRKLDKTNQKSED